MRSELCRNGRMDGVTGAGHNARGILQIAMHLTGERVAPDDAV